MLVVGMLEWWWTRGWGIFVATLKDRLSGMLDFFSFGALLRTLFSPFRQISAGQVDGSMQVRFQAWLDRTFSRMIGALVRLFLIVAGAIIVIIQTVLSAALIILWPLVPVAPVICIVLTVMGVGA